MRLLELQRERDSLQACAAARAAPDGSLRGWAVLLDPSAASLARALQSPALTVLQGEAGLLAVGSLSQLAVAAQRRRSRTGPSCCGAPRRWRPRCARAPGSCLAAGCRSAPPSWASSTPRPTPSPTAAATIRSPAGCASRRRARTSSTWAANPPVPAPRRWTGRRSGARTVPVIRELARRTRLPHQHRHHQGRGGRGGARCRRGDRQRRLRAGARPRPGRAAAGAAFCLMHMRGTPADMQARATYADLHGEVLAELEEVLRRAREGGIPEERIALDPGIGFAKTGAQNLLLLRRLRELAAAGAAASDRGLAQGVHRRRHRQARRRTGSSAAWLPRWPRP